MNEAREMINLLNKILEKLDNIENYISNIDGNAATIEYNTRE